MCFVIPFVTQKISPRFAPIALTSRILQHVISKMNILKT